MIKYAILWLEKHSTLIEQMGISMTEINKTQGLSFYVDFANANYCARLTLWKTGDCDLEVISIASEELIYWAHQGISNMTGIEEAFSLLLSKMQ